MLLISEIGRRDLRRGPLANATDGGDGVWGRVVTELERQNNPAKKPENRAASSNRMSINNPMKKPEVAAKLSAKLTGRSQPLDVVEKIRRSNTGKKRSVEFCKKISSLMRGKPRPVVAGDNNVMRRPEVRLKNSLAQKDRPLSAAHLASLQGSHTGHKWIVNLSTGETLMRSVETTEALVATGAWKYGRTL
jgi:hypothetical protein